MWVQSLSREDALEQGMATHSGILNLENPMDRGAWRATVHRMEKSQKRLKRLRIHAGQGMRRNYNDELLHLALLCKQLPQNTETTADSVCQEVGSDTGDGFSVFDDVWGLPWETWRWQGGPTLFMVP